MGFAALYLSYGLSSVWLCRLHERSDLRERHVRLAPPPISLRSSGATSPAIRSSFLTLFWRCGRPQNSSRTGPERAPRQRTVNGFGRGFGCPKGLAMLIRSKKYGVRGGAAKAAPARPAASAPTLLLGGLLLLIGP